MSRFTVSLLTSYLSFSRDDVVTWLNESLLPRLLDETRLLQDTGSVLLGTLRLRQIHDGECLTVQDFTASNVDNARCFFFPLPLAPQHKQQQHPSPKTTMKLLAILQMQNGKTLFTPHAHTCVLIVF